MLPDYPDLKRALRRTLEYQIKQQALDDPVLSMIRNTILHEGRAVHMVREDGSTQDINFDKPIEGRTELKVDDIRQKGAGVSVSAAKDLADQLQAGMAKQTFDILERTTSEFGNSFDAGGKPLSAEHVLLMYEKIETDFDPDGTWHRPTIVVGPALTARAEAVFKEIEETPALKQRLKSIVDKKREEWRVREASRKLVD